MDWPVTALTCKTVKVTLYDFQGHVIKSLASFHFSPLEHLSESQLSHPSGMPVMPSETTAEGHQVIPSHMRELPSQTQSECLTHSTVRYHQKNVF